MKKGNMELGKKIITWAMAAVMTVTSVGGSFGTMTVYATDAPTAAEIIADSSDVAQAAADVADAAEVAADAAEATKEAAEAAKEAKDAAEALADAVYGKEATETTEAVDGYVHTVTDSETGETTEKVVADVETEISAAEEAINANNTAVEAANTDVATITTAEKTTEEMQTNAEKAAEKAEVAKEAAKEALEAVLAAPADSPEGNQEAAEEAAKLAKAAYDDAVTAEGEAKAAAEKAAAEVVVAQEAYADLAKQLDAIETKTADAEDKLGAAERELEEAQKAFAEAEKIYQQATQVKAEVILTVEQAQKEAAKAEAIKNAASTNEKTALTNAEKALNDANIEKNNLSEELKKYTAEYAEYKEGLTEESSEDEKVKDYEEKIASLTAALELAKNEVKKAESAVKEAKAAVEASAAANSVDTIKDKLAEVKSDTDYDTLVKNDEEAKKAVEVAEQNVEKITKENQPKIEKANDEKATLEADKAKLEADKADFEAKKETADSIVEAGDSHRFGFGSNIAYYKYVAQRTPGWDGPFVYWDKNEIDEANKYVAAYNKAVEDSASYASKIEAIGKDIEAKGKDIEAKGKEIEGYNGLIGAAEKAKKEADEVATLASTRLSAINSYIYSGEAVSYEMTEDEKNAYNDFVQEMEDSAIEYGVASRDTIKYIDATNETVWEKFVGLFTLDTFKDFLTEIDLEGDYHGKAWYSTDGTCYIFKEDEDNAKFLIAMTNGKFVASKIDEMEAAAFKASFDAIVAADAASVVADELQREAAALAKYQAAKEALEAAQAKYDALAKIKTTQANLEEAEKAVEKAKDAADAAADAYAEAVVDRKVTENYYDWANALATQQKTRGDVQLDPVTGKPATANNNGFDLTDETVKGQSATAFEKMTDGKATVEVPYDVYKKYVAVMYKEYAYEVELKGTVVDENTKLADREGKGIASETLGMIYWEIGEDGTLTGNYFESEDKLVDGTTYFVSYSFKHHRNDGYHLDGIFYTYDAPETPAGGDGGSTGGGSSSRSSRSSSDEGAVLGAKREQEGLVPEEGQVLGAVRAPKTSDSSKAILWMLVMGGSALGAAAVLAQKKKEEA